MSHFTINKFDNSTQEISFKLRIEENCSIQAIRLKVLKCGALQDGELTLKLSSNSNVIGTKSLSIENINTIEGTYAHGFMKFEFTEQVIINKDQYSPYAEITVTLSMTDHTEDSNNYFALIREEAPFTEEFGDRPPLISDDIDTWFNPYGIEIYSITRK